MRRSTIVHRAALAAAGIAMLAGVLVRAAEPAKQAAPPAASQQVAPRALLDKYCVGCHSDRLKTGGLTLQTIDVENASAGAETWEKVIRKLRTGTMPPAGMPRPDHATVAGLATWLETKVDEGAAASPNPGRAPLHRLNRVEYTNAIRDLLALEIDGKSMLPADAAGHGFDNIADALSLTPGLLERYLLVAQTVSRLAVADPTMRPSASVYTLPFTLLQADRMGDDMPFGSRGGIAVRHYFPLDGEYTLQIRLQRHAVSVGHDIRGLDELNEIDVRVDGARVKLFTIGGQAAEQDGDLRGPDRGTPLERTGDDALVLRFPAKAGNRLLSVMFRKTTWMQEGVGMSRLPVASYGFASGRKSSTDYGKIEAGIESVEIAGPYGAAPSETASRARIFVCRPAAERDEAACAQKILSTLARRAYRRPVTTDDVDTLMTFYKEGRTGATFDAGIQAALERVLVDPDFLVRAETAPAKAAAGSLYRISDLELASRLSFFLWSSIPDDQLVDLAARGRLKDQAVLEQQVRRMIADPRAKALTANFFGQWLWTRNIGSTAPDPKAFPEFDENLRLAFQHETDLFLESQLRENRSVLDLLTANYTFVNERLAKHYGIPNVYGPHFRRVTLPDDRRAGLLGQGSVLTVTSYPNRTSPVVRGKWLLENFLGVPPPDPPANVPPFPEEEGLTVTRSVRERLEQHRKNPTCAACHNQMDPLGFALENFDAVGKWRVTEARTPINASGTLPNGVKFNGPAEFRNALMNHRDAFVKTLTEKLLTYAMGRGVEYYDLPAVRQIMRESAAQDYRWSAVVLSIVKSLPFQMRRAQS